MDVDGLINTSDIIIEISSAYMFKEPNRKVQIKLVLKLIVYFLNTNETLQICQLLYYENILVYLSVSFGVLAVSLMQDTLYLCLFFLVRPLLYSYYFN